MDTSTLVSEQKTELVLGLVGAVGTDLDWVTKETVQTLKCFAYQVETVHLSSLCKHHAAGANIDDSSEYQRISTSMDAGNNIRANGRRGDALALRALAEIARRRCTNAGQDEGSRWRPGVVWLLRSLKHPDEVALLRKVYGPGFWLIGVYCNEDDRVKNLVSAGMSDEEARKLNERDTEESMVSLGQRTRDTFAQSDVFIGVRGSDFSQAKGQLARFLDLVFANPHVTPSHDEHAMFLAYAASLRSGDLSRQVGASICDPRGNLLAVGANDVPATGGGLQWPGGADQRDHVVGYDFNERKRRELARELLCKVSPAASEDVLQRQLEQIRGCKLFDITEYGRAVHAEMEALLACARTGVSTQGATLYCTTFPCHNCAKHIIAAGVQTVRFVEPYPKSLAGDMYPNDVALDESSEDRVRFAPYLGVAARRYIDLFAMSWGGGCAVRRKQEGGRKAEWQRSEATPRIPMVASTALQREVEAVSSIDDEERM